MKTNFFKTALIAATAFFACSFSASAASPFSKLMDRNDLEFTYISKNLVKQKSYKLQRGGMNMATLVPKVESLYIIEAEEKSGREACKKAMTEFKNSNKGEVIMSSKDGDEINMIIGVPNNSKAEGESEYQSIVVYSEDSGEISIVVINDEPPTSF